MKRNGRRRKILSSFSWMARTEYDRVSHCRWHVCFFIHFLCHTNALTRKSMCIRNRWINVCATCASSLLINSLSAFCRIFIHIFFFICHTSNCHQNEKFHSEEDSFRKRRIFTEIERKQLSKNELNKIAFTWQDVNAFAHFPLT